nr:uncharacterized protein LOC127346948 [Lolium perenne]
MAVGGGPPAAGGGAPVAPAAGVEAPVAQAAGGSPVAAARREITRAAGAEMERAGARPLRCSAAARVAGYAAGGRPTGGARPLLLLGGGAGARASGSVDARLGGHPLREVAGSGAALAPARRRRGPCSCSVATDVVGGARGGWRWVAEGRSLGLEGAIVANEWERGGGSGVWGATERICGMDSARLSCEA